MSRVRVPSPAFRHRLTSTDYSCQCQLLHPFSVDLLAGPFCQRLSCLFRDCREFVQALVQAFARPFPWPLSVGHEDHHPVAVKVIHPKRQRHRVTADRCRWTSSGQLSSVAWRLEPCGPATRVGSSRCRVCRIWSILRRTAMPTARLGS